MRDKIDELLYSIEIIGIAVSLTLSVVHNVNWLISSLMFGIGLSINIIRN